METTLPLGELSALGSAFLWSLNAVMLRPVTGRVAALRITSLQYATTSVFVLTVALVMGKLPAIAAIPSPQVLALVGAALLGMGAGDTSYVRGLSLLGVARSFTFANAGYVFLTTALAVLFLAEPLTMRSVLGAALLLSGMGVVVQAQSRDREGAEGVAVLAPTCHGRRRGALRSPLSGGEGQGEGARHGYRKLPPSPQPSLRQGEEPGPPHPLLTGLALCALAAVCWAATASVLKATLAGVDVLAANSLRIPSVAFALSAVTLVHHGFDRTVYTPRTVLVVSVAGVLGLGLGSLLFLFGIQEAGAAKTAMLSSTSPVFAAGLALVVLRERLTLTLAAGTALSVAGAWLVI